MQECFTFTINVQLSVRNSNYNFDSTNTLGSNNCVAVKMSRNVTQHVRDN